MLIPKFCGSAIKSLGGGASISGVKNQNNNDKAKKGQVQDDINRKCSSFLASLIIEKLRKFDPPPCIFLAYPLVRDGNILLRDQVEGHFGGEVVAAVLAISVAFSALAVPTVAAAALATTTPAALTPTALRRGRVSRRVEEVAQVRHDCTGLA